MTNDTTSMNNDRPEEDAADAAFAEEIAQATASAQAAGASAEELAKARGELAEANDRVLRTQAELENYRKRARRELEDEKRYAALPLVRDLLHVLDNLERAIEASERNPNTGGLLEGVKMVAIQLHTYLEQHQCRRIPAVGMVFDPHQHEAIAQEPSTEVPAGSVTRVARHGYQLHERVVRPAQVLVSVGPPAQAAVSPEANPGA